MINNEVNTCIIACESLKQELNLAMQKLDCDLPVYWIDAGKHAWPDKLRVSIQETLDGLPGGCRVLLLFGFCGNALVGIQAGTRTLILPKVADCIPLFIGSKKERDTYGTDTYFFTEGYINSGGSIANDTSKVTQRYGKQRGLSILKQMLRHYHHFAVIDTGAYEVQNVLDKVEEFAKLVAIPVKVIPGNLRYIEALLAGDWPDSTFLTIPPGGSISFEDSLNAGKAQ